MSDGIVSAHYGGVDYRLVKLPPKDAGRLALRVGQIMAALAQDKERVAVLITKAKSAMAAGGTPADKAEAAKKAIFDDVIGSSDMLAALAGSISNIDADKLYDIGLECVSGKLFAEHKLHDDTAFNAHFQEHPKNMLPIMAWAIKENCGGFFGLGAKG